MQIVQIAVRKLDLLPARTLASGDTHPGGGERQVGCHGVQHLRQLRQVLDPDQALPQGRASVEALGVPAAVFSEIAHGGRFTDELADADANLSAQITSSVVFLEPRRTLMPFKWRNHSVSRTGFCLSHGCVRTSTACQGKTLEGGVLIDAAPKEGGAYATDEDDLWLHLYVMLSRATTLNDILVIRAPPVDFLLRGPPAQLRERLKLFARRTESCHARAEQLAHELGLARFFH